MGGLGVMQALRGLSWWERPVGSDFERLQLRKPAFFRVPDGQEVSRRGLGMLISFREEGL